MFVKYKSDKHTTAVSLIKRTQRNSFPTIERRQSQARAVTSCFSLPFYPRITRGFCLFTEIQVLPLTRKLWNLNFYIYCTYFWSELLMWCPQLFSCTKIIEVCCSLSITVRYVMNTEILKVLFLKQSIRL